MKYCFGDIVVVEDSLIGVVCKCWGESNRGTERNYDIYVRMFNSIKNYPESQVQRYMVRHKYLDDEEMEWQKNVLEE